MENKKITLEQFAEYKVRMQIAKEVGDRKNFKKYYELVAKGYEDLTGKNFEEEMKKISSTEEKTK